ncbi:hypothetical protein FPOA_13000 [Fusarium poae]|uniref:Uncharacterized protein n=1 Tax=Fusarium poae TaxID=36050 RepID=A0A1B8A778_FUSPO|nr:hypothetical protein FPOA_13000 [Fusarium poae]
MSMGFGRRGRKSRQVLAWCQDTHGCGWVGLKAKSTRTRLYNFYHNLGVTMIPGRLTSAHPPSHIDIADISTMALLHAMVQASRTSRAAPMMEHGQSWRKKAMSQRPDCDCNGPYKWNFLIDPERYDEDNGEGAMQKVVTKIREERRRTG